jgi:kelch-like protein 10
LEDGGHFLVHRVVLSACSSYFLTLFTTTIHSVEKSDVYLPGVTSEVMSSILEYAYLRFVDINQENVQELLVSADYLSVLGLHELCCDFLRSRLDIENCISIMKFAREYFCANLEKDARFFLMSNFVEVSQNSAEILDLPLEELKDIVVADELNVKHEEVVWECILRWINHDALNRKGNMLKLFRRLRLGLFDNCYFHSKVKYHPYVVENEECCSIVLDTIMLQYDSAMIMHNVMERSLQDFARARIPHEVIFAIGGWNGGEPTNNIETYDTRLDRWLKIEAVDPKGPRTFHGTAVIGFNIYVIGGFDGMFYLNTCRCFNAVTKTWREVAPMHIRRCYLSVVMLDDMVYSLGGYDGHERQKTGEVYEYQRNQWTVIAPMNVQRSDASAAALNGKIYITGGFNGEEHVNSSEVYDPNVNQWTLIKEMQFGRSGLSCIAYHGCLYAIGGFSGTSCLSTVEKYNPITETWTLAPDTYKARTNFGIVVIDDMIFTIGGIRDFTPLNEVECYDETSNEWYQAGKMNIYLLGLSACVVASLPNVCDYIHENRDIIMEEQRMKLLAEERERHETEHRRERRNQARRRRRRQEQRNEANSVNRN